MKTHRVLGEPCPVCGTVLDAAMPVTGVDAPKPGDMTVCVHCLSFLRFGEGRKLTELTAQEIGYLLDEERMALVRAREFLKRAKAEPTRFVAARIVEGE